jgi:uncharacterized membrane protein YdbT with pleckstrin-like domain
MAKMYIENLLGETERILHTARQHWFVLASSILFEIIVIMVIFTLTILGIAFNWTEPWIIGLAGALLILIPIGTMTRDILIWSNHQYLVTNWRVIQISGIINKNVMDSSLDKVNDVKMTQSFFGRIFGYGDVEIMTGSELGVNLFRRIEEPVRLKTAMINAKESATRRSNPSTPAPAQGNDITGILAQLGDLRHRNILTEEEFQKMKSELLAKQSK